MHLRPARESEASVLSEIARHAKGYWGYSPTQLAAWHGELTLEAEQMGACPCWVAQVEAGPAGFFLLVPAAPHWVLEHFWVTPAHMGRGIGRALLEKARALAAGGGSPQLAIDADPHAEAFYLACGARHVGALPAPLAGWPLRTRPQLLLATA